MTRTQNIQRAPNPHGLTLATETSASERLASAGATAAYRLRNRPTAQSLATAEQVLDVVERGSHAADGSAAERLGRVISELEREIRQAHERGVGAPRARRRPSGSRHARSSQGKRQFLSDLRGTLRSSRGDTSIGRVAAQLLTHLPRGRRASLAASLTVTDVRAVAREAGLNAAQMDQVVSHLADNAVSALAFSARDAASDRMREFAEGVQNGARGLAIRAERQMSGSVAQTLATLRRFERLGADAELYRQATTPTERRSALTTMMSQIADHVEAQADQVRSYDNDPLDSLRMFDAAALKTIARGDVDHHAARRALVGQGDSVLALGVSRLEARAETQGDVTQAGMWLAEQVLDTVSAGGTSMLRHFLWGSIEAAAAGGDASVTAASEAAGTTSSGIAEQYQTRASDARESVPETVLSDMVSAVTGAVHEGGSVAEELVEHDVADAARALPRRLMHEARERTTAEADHRDKTL